MSDEVLAPILTVLLITALVLWVPAIAVGYTLYRRLQSIVAERYQRTESPDLELVERA